MRQDLVSNLKPLDWWLDGAIKKHSNDDVNNNWWLKNDWLIIIDC